MKNYTTQFKKERAMHTMIMTSELYQDLEQVAKINGPF